MADLSTFQILQEFIVVTLHSAEEAANLPPIKDPDALIHSELMDDRDAFTDFLLENRYEFSSLRRSKFSTMALLFALHHPEKANYTCNNCAAHVETPHHCTTCEVNTYTIVQSIYFTRDS